MKITKIFLTFASFLLLNCAYGQEEISTTGGVISGSGGSASYAVGQLTTTTLTGTTGSVNNGLLQPYEIVVVLGLAEAIDITAYPNPTQDNVNIHAEFDKHVGLTYVLYNMNGQRLLQDDLTSKKGTIDMKDLPSDTYFLKILKKSNEIKTFKIVKTR